MSVSDKDAEILRYIIRYCGRITEVINRSGGDADAFVNDQDSIELVSFSLIQIGEYAKRLSQDFVEATKSDIQWHAIVSFRNLIAHNYEAIIYVRLWDTACNDIPALGKFCQTCLSE